MLTHSLGGGIIANAKKDSTTKVGAYVVVGGLALQLIFFGLFILVAVVFNRRIVRTPTSLSQDPGMPFFKHLYALYAASALIMVRSIFRMVEYVQGNDGFLLGHEYFLYVFDAALMFGVMVVLNVVHPSEVKAMLRGGKAFMNGFQMVEK